MLFRHQTTQKRHGVICSLKLEAIFGAELQDARCLPQSSLIEMKCTEHKINHFKVNNSVLFSIFTMLYNHHLQFQNILITPKRRSILIKQLFPIVPSSQPLVTTTCFLSLWTYLVWISYTNGIRYVTHLVISLSIMFSKSMQIIAYITTPFLLWLDNISLCIYIKFVYSSAH